jgi:hypothetical protein
MATLGDLWTFLREWTGVPATILTDPIATELVNQTVRTVARAHPWRGFEVSAKTTYPAHAAAVTVPTDFISEQALYRQTTDPTYSSGLEPITKVPDRESWFATVGVNRDPLYPQTLDPADVIFSLPRYAIWAGGLYLLPTPTADIAIVMDFARMPADLSAAGDSNHLTTTYADVVRFGALVETYKFLHEDERAETWQAQYGTALTTAIAHDKTLAMSGGTMARGV